MNKELISEKFEDYVLRTWHELDVLNDKMDMIILKKHCVKKESERSGLDNSIIDIYKAKGHLMRSIKSLDLTLIELGIK